METYTLVVGNVQHNGMLMGESVTIGNVILGPVPGDLRYYLGESETATVAHTRRHSSRLPDNHGTAPRSHCANIRVTTCRTDRR